MHKFRVWDEETSRMYSGNNAIVTFNGVLEEVYVRNINTINELIDYKLMKSTRFADKEVNEIYEGDIVKTSAGAIGIIKFGRYSTMDINGDNNIGFYIEWKLDISMRVDLGYWLERISVIGNIYENPELLR